MAKIQAGRRVFLALFTFVLASVLAGALAIPAFADDAALADGDYTIDVVLTGGSGKASVSSPTSLTVADGAMTASIEWSSPHYDLMIVDGENYLPVNTEGNSVFEIPVSALDVDLPIQAETTAMSQPHLIDYALHFDSSTVSPAKQGGNAGVHVNKTIAIIGIIIVVAGAIFAIYRSLKMREK